MITPTLAVYHFGAWRGPEKLSTDLTGAIYSCDNY
jgi:hypothetical protein